MSNELNISHNFLLYTNDQGDIKVDVLLKDESIWLTINQMAELFGIDKSGISRHIKNILETGELQEGVVVAKIASTTQHGAMAGKKQTKAVMCFNLDMIISVGYRVNSIRGTHFRIWATQQLRELIIKGFVLYNLFKRTYLLLRKGTVIISIYLTKNNRIEKIFTW